MRSEGQVLWEHWQPGTLSGFQLIAGRLFFREDDRRLFALDSVTGRVLWTRRGQSSFLRWPDVPGRLHSFEARENIVLLPDRSEVAYVATAMRGITTSESDDIRLLSEAYDEIRSRALPVEMSRDLIRRILEERWT